MPSFDLRSRLAAWFGRWGGIVPLLVAEFIAWVGFGALLPVMPIYFRAHGVDLAMLGVVVAAWPGARLIAEPLFGWLADRNPRIPIMVAGLLLTGAAIALPLVFVGPIPFLVLRILAGLGTAAYDPAARGYLTDATTPGRRGEAFGLYGAAQMGGLLLGPAIGGLGAALFGGIEVVFAFAGLAAILSGIAIWWRVPERPSIAGRRPTPSVDLPQFPAEAPFVHGRAATEWEAEGSPVADAPTSLWNRRLAAALVLNLGSYFAGGAYEVIWSLFLQSKGAGLDLIGLTFAMFGLPVLLFSPFAGRWVDRRGGFGFIVFGALAAAVASTTYTVLPEVLLVIPVLWLEATGFALLSPALFAVVAAGSPAGRSSTAQGIYGAAGTVGTIVASIVAGYLASIDLRYPFWVGTVVMLTCLVTGLAIGGSAIRGVFGQRPESTEADRGLNAAV